jgi:hypothetical protein
MYLLLTYCLPVNLAFLSVEAAAAAAAAAPPQPTHGGRPWLGHWLAWTLLSASSIRHAPSQAIDRSSLFLFSSFGRSKTCEFQTALLIFSLCTGGAFGAFAPTASITVLHSNSCSRK